MNKNLTELVFILDRSGSMGGLEADTIGGFNAMLEKQKREPGDALVSTVLFDHETLVLHDRLPLDRVPPMTAADYCPRGSTALIDAIGSSIHHISTIHKYARQEDVPARTLFVITTDGMENASSRFSSDQVKAMIEERKQTVGWEFLFIGANIDAVETAKHFGIQQDRVASYVADSQGTETLYDSVANAVCQVRSARPLSKSWNQRLNQDHSRRGKK